MKKRGLFLYGANGTNRAKESNGKQPNLLGDRRNDAKGGRLQHCD